MLAFKDPLTCCGMEASYVSEFEAIKSVASKLNTSEEAVRRWRRKPQIDAGERPGVTSSEHAGIRNLKRDVAELRTANEILKSASGGDPESGVHRDS